MKFTVKKKYENVREDVFELEETNGKLEKVKKDKISKRELTNKEMALEEAKARVRGLGYIDFTLEHETEDEYVFSFYNLIDFARTSKEKKDKRENSKENTKDKGTKD